MFRTRFPLVFSLLTVCVATVSAGYTAGGTFVVKTELGTLVDNGGVICQGTNGDGIGGGCLRFPDSSREPRDDGTFGGAFVRVHDDSAGAAVAFQVCIDNNGDGICGGPFAEDDPCFDQIYFSHDDEGKFFNALGPLPTSFLRGCESNGGFAGYVVLLCQGTHDTDVASPPHAHTLSSGSITLAREGSGYGTFCGGGLGGNETVDLGRNPAVAKAYVVE